MMIIDANVAHQFQPSKDRKSPTRGASLGSEWLTPPHGKGTLATGGKNLRELVKTNIGGFVQQLATAGRARVSTNEALHIAQSGINLAIVRSNDVHILASAIESGCRLLFSDDGDLITDFKNTRLISPKGKVFKDERHKRLLC
jgi:hypothetical protein